MQRIREPNYRVAEETVINVYSLLVGACIHLYTKKKHSKTFPEPDVMVTNQALD